MYAEKHSLNERKKERKKERKRHRLIAVASTATTQLNKVEPKAYNGAPGSRYTVHV